MTRHRGHPRQIIQDWSDLVWQRDNDSDPILRRTRFAWWCERWLETAAALRHTWTPSQQAFEAWGPNNNWQTRLFYRFKASFCLLAGWDGGDLDEHVGYKRMLEAEGLTYFNLEHYGTPDGPGGCCEEVRVGIGIFVHWYAYIEHESWP